MERRVEGLAGFGKSLRSIKDAASDHQEWEDHNTQYRAHHPAPDDHKERTMFSYIEFNQALHRHEDLLNEANEYRRHSEVLRNANPLRKLVKHLQAALQKPAPEKKPAMQKGFARQ
jgi:hypothetical protein